MTASERAGSGSGRIAYLTGEYPRATDTFIQREVAVLRAERREVATFSIRRTGPEHHVGPEQVAEAAATFNVLPAAKNPVRMIMAHLGALLRSPTRYLRAIGLAMGSRPPGIKGAVYQLFYFLEAGILAGEMRRRGIGHLHNHIAKQSCNVAMLASEISGIPFSFTLHGPDIFFAPEHWRLDKKIEKARFVACISHFCRSQGMAFSDQAHWDKLHIVHCGVDPARYRFPDRPPTGRILFVGRLAAVKGLPILLQAFQSLSDIEGLRLDVIGDGPDRAALEAQARDAGLEARVRFLGYRAQDEVAAALAESDLFVLPSFAEGVPVVLMEAMAAGVPVVATRIAGIPELVGDGNSGCLVPPGDTGALAQAMRDLLGDPERAQKMGRVGRDAVLAGYDVAVEARRLGILFDAYSDDGPRPAIRPAIRPEVS